jgi:hypothetical protein
MNSNDFPRMVYRAGGTEEIHGGSFATLIVDDQDALDAALADGWHMTTDEAHTPAPVDDAPPARTPRKAKA